MGECTAKYHEYFATVMISHSFFEKKESTKLHAPFNFSKMADVLTLFVNRIERIMTLKCKIVCTI